LAKALHVLELFNSKGVWKANDMVKALGYHRSTIQRIVGTLESEGFLERGLTSKNAYSLGLKMLSLKEVAIENVNLERVARPVLERLVGLTQESAHLFVRSGYKCRCIVYIDSPLPVRFVSDKELDMPLHCTGVGKALMSGMNETEIDELIAAEGLARFSENTITDRERLMDELAQVRRDGVAYDREEFEVGVACIGAPVSDRASRAVAAISIAMPISRMLPEMIPRFTAHVKDAARILSEKLGYRLHIPKDRIDS
jgi:DNA-binding IclR family transcriptional regulator